jgi:protein gp37
MSANSKIEWTHHTFNPWWGCVKVSDGCKNCYAERDSKRYGLQVWGQTADRKFFGDKHWAEPLKWDGAAEKAGQRHRVFSASFADVFEDRPDLNLPRVRLFQTILHTPHLDWLLVTKRPENLTKMLPWCLDNITDAERAPWPNVWLLTSVENQEAADQRIPELLKAPAVVHGLSCEPLLGPVELREDFLLRPRSSQRWVIVGGESGPNARPMHPDWPRALRDQCQDNDVPFFFKQWGEWAWGYPAPSGTPGRYATTYPDGRWVETQEYPRQFTRFAGAVLSRVGKKPAGRQLDNRTWDEFPQPMEAAR